MSTSRTFQNLPPDKKERILEGALSEFADKGYGRASLNTIVARVGIAKGSIFQYFTDKPGLFGHVFHYAVEKVKDHLRDLRRRTRDQDVFTRLHLSLLAGLDLLEEHPRLFRLYLRTLFESDIPFRATLLQSVLAFGRDYILELLEEGRELGQLDPELDLELAAFVVEAVLERYLVARALEHMDPGLGLHRAGRERAQELAGRMVDILRRGLGGGR